MSENASASDVSLAFRFSGYGSSSASDAMSIRASVEPNAYVFVELTGAIAYLTGV